MSDQIDNSRPEARVDLPAAAEGELEVYVNGILQQPGSDYVLDGRTLIFPRHLEPEVQMSKLQLLRAALGIAGTYPKHDTIDIIYEHDGRKLVATGLKPTETNAVPGS